MSFATKCYSGMFVIMTVLAANMLAAEEPAKPIRKVTVSAKAAIEIEPNEVLLTLWVKTKNMDLLKAKAENDVITKAVLALASKHNVPEDQFALTSLEMGPKYERRKYGEKPVFIGYCVDRSINIAIRDFSKLEPILADALKAGVTRVDDLLFRIREPREAEARVRRKAVEHAREKAAQLAKLNGLALGAPLEIDSDINHNEQVWGGMGGMMGSTSPAPGKTPFRLVSQRFARPVQAKEAKNADKLLAPGTITLESTVTIVFEMIAPKK